MDGGEKRGINGESEPKKTGVESRGERWEGSDLGG